MTCATCSDECSSATSVEWVIKQGALFRHGLRVVRSSGGSFNLTGYEVRCQFRRGTFESRTAAIAVATCVVTSAAQGRFTVQLGASVTRGMYDSGVFDIEVYNPLDEDEVYRVYAGTWRVSLEATLDGA